MSAPPDAARGARWWLVALPVLLVAVGAGWVAWGRPGPVSTAEAPTPLPTVPVTSDAPVHRSLVELMAASHLVVRGHVETTEHGRWFGDGQGGSRIQSRLITLQVDAVLAGPSQVPSMLLVEEEGWLEDGSLVSVDGAAPTRVGDDAIWFLVQSGDADVGTHLVTNAQGRYLVSDEGDLTGAEGDDPLTALLAGLGADRLTAEVGNLVDHLGAPTG